MIPPTTNYQYIIITILKTKNDKNHRSRHDLSFMRESTAMKKHLIFLALIFVSSLSAKTLNLFILGTGGVGTELIEQIAEKPTYHNVKLRVVAIANSKKMLFNHKGIALDSWKSALETSVEPMNISDFIKQMFTFHLKNSVFVDCTASQAVADVYVNVLACRISIVTPNKKANTSSMNTYSMMKQIAAKNRVAYLYDATVGAGLPILSTLQNLPKGSDDVYKVQAILSGTLSYLFNTFDGSSSFSECVRSAQALGFTEPDPRDDLNGMDVARKLLIIARELGYTLELSDIVLEPFLPKSCFDAPTVEAFYQELERCDGQMATLMHEALSQGKRLRFIATFEEGKAKISLEAIERSHPFYDLTGTTNIAAITSKYYPEPSPLVIKGPGAGFALTASKVLQGIINTI